MIVKEAGLERANMMDPEHGHPILISTTARKFFREQFPDHAKTRNWVVNQYLAGMFANSRPTNYFRPKQGDENDVGEIREGGGGKFIGIVAPDHVRVIAIKGGLSGALPALEPQAGQTEQIEMFEGGQEPQQTGMMQDVGEALQGAS